MEIRIPDIGDFGDVPVIEVHISPGSVVAVDDPLVTLESDKATMDVPSPRATRSPSRIRSSRSSPTRRRWTSPPRSPARSRSCG